METINTNKQFLLTQEEIATRIYLVNNKLYKLVKVYDEPDYEQEYKDFIELMSFLSRDLLFYELVKPIDLVRCQEYDRKRMGYTMEYLDKHYSFATALNLESLQTKKEYFKRVAAILKRIKEYGMAYDDIHGENILVHKFTDEIKFIDPDSLKIEGINTEDISKYELREKLQFTQLMLSAIYDTDMSFNYYYKMSDKLKGLHVSKEMMDYIKSIEGDVTPSGYITDFKQDFEPDVVRFNKKITDRRRMF